MKKLFSVCAVVLLSLLPTLAADRQIVGDYVEARTAEVYAGACFTNSELGLTGDQAILAWRVHRGDWQGVDLSGMAVVAVVKAEATLGDRWGSSYPARSIVIVDSKATLEQSSALLDFAHTMAGSLLDNIVAVEQQAIEMNEAAHGSVSVSAGNDIRLQTRSLREGDHLCRNAERYYEPLVELTHAMPVYTLAHVFSGQSLGQTWSSPYKASAYVGRFER